ncbi:hypothetical protein D3C76_1631400 [compost metagenome]
MVRQGQAGERRATEADVGKGTVAVAAVIGPGSTVAGGLVEDVGVTVTIEVGHDHV